MNETDSQLSDKLFVKLMVLAQEKNPELSDEVKQKIKQIYLQLQDAGKEDSKYLSAEFFDPTRIQTVKLMSISYARLDLSDTVEIEHLERANKMLRKYYKTYGFEFGKDSTDEFNLDLRESNRIKKFNELVDSKFVIDSEIEFADIVETYKEENQDLEDISKSKVEEKVEELAEKSDKYYLQDQNLHKHE